MKERSYQLNRDITIKICLYGDPGDLQQFELVSRHWREAVQQTWSSVGQSPPLKHTTYIKRRDYVYGDKEQCIKATAGRSNGRTSGLLVFGGIFGSEQVDCCLFDDDNKYLNGHSLDNANMPRGLGSMAATRDSWGNVLSMGGWDDRAEQCVNTCLSFDPRNKLGWQPQHPIARPMCFCAATTTRDGNIILVGGGDGPYRGAEVFKTCYARRPIYDMTNEHIFTNKSTRDTAHYEPLSVLRTHDATHNEMWFSLPDLLEKRCGHVCVTTFNDEIVAVGGYAGGMDYLSSLEILDWQAGGRWTKLPDMTYKRSGPGVGVGPDGCIYVVGGSPDGLLGHTSLERLDLREGKWQKLEDMNYGRGYTAACWGRGYSFFVSGGLKADGPGEQSMFQKTMECYDSRANKWIILETDNDNNSHNGQQSPQAAAAVQQVIVPELTPNGGNGSITAGTATAAAPTAAQIVDAFISVADHYNLDSDDDDDDEEGAEDAEAMDYYYGDGNSITASSSNSSTGSSEEDNNEGVGIVINDDEDESDGDDDHLVIDEPVLELAHIFLNPDASLDRQRSRLLSRAGHQMMFIY